MRCMLLASCHASAPQCDFCTWVGLPGLLHESCPLAGMRPHEVSAALPYVQEDLGAPTQPAASCAAGDDSSLWSCAFCQQDFGRTATALAMEARLAFAGALPTSDSARRPCWLAARGGWSEVSVAAAVCCWWPSCGQQQAAVVSVQATGGFDWSLLLQLAC